MSWWARAAGSVGVLPSLLVVVGLTLVTLAGHAGRSAACSAEARQRSGAVCARPLPRARRPSVPAPARRWTAQWSLPPWPVFAALAAITLGTSAAALWSRRRDPARGRRDCRRGSSSPSWSASAGAPEWGLTAVLAAAAVSAYALAWLPLAGRFRASRAGRVAAGAASSSASCRSSPPSRAARCPPFPVLLLAHVVNLCALLALTTHPSLAVTWRSARSCPRGWRSCSGRRRGDLATAWPQLLTLSVALYAVFAAYPFVVGARARDSRDPYLAAVLASAMAFFGARAAFVAGGLDWMIGAIPVVEGAVLALLLRQLLQPRAGGHARPRPPRARRRRRAGVRHRRDSAAARSSSGSRSAGRSKAPRWRGSTGASRIAGCSTRRVGAARRGLRPAGAQPGGASSTSRAARCGSSTGTSTPI